MNSPVKSNIRYTGIRVVIVVAFFAAWELLVGTGIIDPFYVSQPSRVINDFGNFYSSGALYKHTSVTLFEAFTGLFFGMIAGISIGFLLGRVESLGRILNQLSLPFMEFPSWPWLRFSSSGFGLGIESRFSFGLMVFIWYF